jgi:hypothetical protein
MRYVKPSDEDGTNSAEPFQAGESAKNRGTRL